jgi:hypothetical protein
MASGTNWPEVAAALSTPTQTPCATFPLIDRIAVTISERGADNTSGHLSRVLEHLEVAFNVTIEKSKRSNRGNWRQSKPYGPLELLIRAKGNRKSMAIRRTNPLGAVEVLRQYITASGGTVTESMRSTTAEDAELIKIKQQNCYYFSLPDPIRSYLTEMRINPFFGKRMFAGTNKPEYEAFKRRIRELLGGNELLTDRVIIHLFQYELIGGSPVSQDMYGPLMGTITPINPGLGHINKLDRSTLDLFFTTTPGPSADPATTASHLATHGWGIVPPPPAAPAASAASALAAPSGLSVPAVPRGAGGPGSGVGGRRRLRSRKHKKSRHRRTRSRK